MRFESASNEVSRAAGRAVAAGALALSLFAATPARAESPKEACARAYDATQSDRRAGKLASARESAAACTNVACPDFIRQDCGKWLEQIDAAQPSIVLHVRRAKQDLTAVEVELDGHKWLERLDGRAAPIDPGQHQLRFSSGGVTVERPLLVVEGERNRLVEVDLEASPKADTAAPITPWIIGGVGIAALVAGGVMTGVLLHEKSINDTGCPSNRATCTPEGKSAAETGNVLGPITTVTFVVGGAGVAASALWLLVARRRPAAAVGVTPVLTGTTRGAAIGGSF